MHLTAIPLGVNVLFLAQRPLGLNVLLLTQRPLRLRVIIIISWLIVIGPSRQ